MISADIADLLNFPLVLVLIIRNLTFWLYDPSWYVFFYITVRYCQLCFDWNINHGLSNEVLSVIEYFTDKTKWGFYLSTYVAYLY